MRWNKYPQERDNKSAQTKRSLNKTHGQTESIKSAIYKAVSINLNMSPQEKMQLADDMLSRYPGSRRGEVNHQIERAIRHIRQYGRRRK